MEIKWESILGHEQNIVRLKTLLQEQKMPHALLFFGPEGVGKLKAARVLAAALLCAEKDAPCGRCASCQALLMDTHPDFYEILPESKGKAAKSIKIEQVRAMQTEIARIPILSSRRVVVIDGAETMNDAAANNTQHVLVFIDLDKFKAVNDSAGHAAGDALLRELAELMQKHLRS